MRIRLHIDVREEEDGGYVAFCDEYPEAVGQGETVAEAVKDLMEGLVLLREVIEEEEADVLRVTYKPVSELRVRCSLGECPYKGTTWAAHCVSVLPNGTLLLCSYAVLERR